jgi:hypothetical protein
MYLSALTGDVSEGVGPISVLENSVADILRTIGIYSNQAALFAQRCQPLV